jgi:hypothetical protein
MNLILAWMAGLAVSVVLVVIATIYAELDQPAVPPRRSELLDEEEDR